MAPVELTEILDYLLIEPPDCFRWVDGGGAIAWRDGPTIAFRNELATILRHQVDKGLPSLGSLLLLLSACREAGPRFGNACGANWPPQGAQSAWCRAGRPMR